MKLKKYLKIILFLIAMIFIVVDSGNERIRKFKPDPIWK